jgi:hypothetical protein
MMMNLLNGSDGGGLHWTSVGRKFENAIDQLISRCENDSWTSVDRNSCDNDSWTSVDRNSCDNDSWASVDKNICENDPVSKC